MSFDLFKKSFLFFVFSTEIFGFGAFANMPDVDHDPEFRIKVSQALAQKASTFEFDVEGVRRVFVLEGRKAYHEMLKNSEGEDLVNLLTYESEFIESSRKEKNGDLTINYVAEVPIGFGISNFHFSVTAVDHEGVDEDGEHPQLSKSLELKAQVSVMNLMRRYEEENGISGIQKSLKDIELDILEVTPQSTSDHETLVALLVLQDQQNVLLDKLADLTRPMSRLDFVKESSLPAFLEQVSQRDLVRILQNLKIIGPALH